MFEGLLPLTPFVPFFAWLLFFAGGRQKQCPHCRTQLPRFVNPVHKTWKQWVEGGSRCSRCGTPTDASGASIEETAHPQRRSIVAGATALVIAALPAFVMLAHLLKP